MSRKKISSEEIETSLALLWKTTSKQGWSGLNAESIVEMAIEIADSSDIIGVSMRQIADRLGVGTMSLYAHVPSKSDLVSLMVDTVYGQLYQPGNTPSDQGREWPDALKFIAAANWELFKLHPWMLSVTGARPFLGPNATRKYEEELRAIDGIGLSDMAMDGIIAMINVHVEGIARRQQDQKKLQIESGMTELEWWNLTEPILQGVMPKDQFPIGSRVGTSVGETQQAAFDAINAFDFGLELIIAGVSGHLSKL